ELDQLEQRDERDDHLGTAAAVRQQLLERQAAAIGERAAEQRDLVLDRERLGLHRVDRRLRHAGHHAIERVEQIEQRHPRQRQRTGLVVARQHAALVEAAAFLLALLEGVRRLLELP